MNSFVVVSVHPKWATTWSKFIVFEQMDYGLPDMPHLICTICPVVDIDYRTCSEYQSFPLRSMRTSLNSKNITTSKIGLEENGDWKKSTGDLTLVFWLWDEWWLKKDQLSHGDEWCDWENIFPSLPGNLIVRWPIQHPLPHWRSDMRPGQWSGYDDSERDVMKHAHASLVLISGSNHLGTSLLGIPSPMTCMVVKQPLCVHMRIRKQNAEHRTQNAEATQGIRDEEGYAHEPRCECERRWQYRWLPIQSAMSSAQPRSWEVQVVLVELLGNSIDCRTSHDSSARQLALFHHDSKLRRDPSVVYWMLDVECWELKIEKWMLIGFFVFSSWRGQALVVFSVQSEP